MKRSSEVIKVALTDEPANPMRIKYEGAIAGVGWFTLRRVRGNGRGI